MTDSALPPAAAAAPFATSPAPVAVVPPQVERFRFSGSGGEYFGIWIVNLFLTVITLGIYSAWAKVRRKRYFYGNTWLADGNFEYHGNPIAILKGRLIAFAAFVAYTLVTQYSPKLGALLFLALMPAVPWIIVRSFAFNAVNSSYRNLRFHFDGRYRDALAAVWPLFLIAGIGLAMPEMDPDSPPQQFGEMWWVFVTPVILLFLYPYVLAKVKLLHVNHSRFGTADFECVATIGQFYKVYLIASLLFVGMVVVFGAIMGILTVATLGIALLLLPVFYLVGGAMMLAYTKSRVGNLVFNTTSVAGGWRFRSTLRMRRLSVIYATNLLAILATVGLMIPWAAVRTAKYRAECLALEGGGNLDAFVGDMSRQVSATGEEVGEMFDVDLSL